MKDALLFLVRALVDHPDGVQVEEEVQGDRIRFRLHVQPDDMGRVIGRQGRNAKAIRSVMRAIAEREGKRVTVEIVG